MVIAAANLSGSIEERRNRTEPSAIAAFIPPGCPPNSGLAATCPLAGGYNGRSAGSNPFKVDEPPRAHGPRPKCVSIRAIVFEVPSLIVVIDVGRS